MEPNLKAKENHHARRKPSRVLLRSAMIVTIAATVARGVMGFTGLLGPNTASFSLISPAQAQQADRLCTLSDVPISPLTTGRLIEKDPPCPLPEITFSSPDGTALTLGDFKGKALVVNLWATWCPPCLKEMPALNRLQATHGSDTFDVIAISQDRGGHATAAKWLEDQNLTDLTVYSDPKATVGRALESPGMPVTLLIDPNGNEVARLYGPAEWDSKEMIEKIGKLLPTAFSGS